MNVIEEAESMAPLWVKALPYVAALLVLVLMLAASYSTGKHYEHQARVAQVAQLNQQHQAQLVAIDQANRKALDEERAKVRATEAQAATDMAAADQQHEKETEDAKRQHETDLRAIHDGALRLRERFACASPAGAGGGQPATAGSPGVGDADAQRGLRPEDAQFFVSESDRADEVTRQLGGAQEVIRTLWRMLTGAPMPAPAQAVQP